MLYISLFWFQQKKAHGENYKAQLEIFLLESLKYNTSNNMLHTMIAKL